MTALHNRTTEQINKEAHMTALAKYMINKLYTGYSTLQHVNLRKTNDTLHYFMTIHQGTTI